jgi:hypothetical protein
MLVPVMLAPLHSIQTHWRIVLGVALLALLVWACLPAPMKAKLKEGWKKFGHALGNFQARILLTVIYAVLLLPFGLLVRIFSDSLHTKKRTDKWLEHPTVPNDMKQAQQQG